MIFLVEPIAINSFGPGGCGSYEVGCGAKGAGGPCECEGGWAW